MKRALNDWPATVTDLLQGVASREGVGVEDGVADGVDDGALVRLGFPVELGLVEGVELGVAVGLVVAVGVTVTDGDEVEVIVGVGSGVAVTVGVGIAGSASSLFCGARTPIVPATASVAAATPATVMMRRRTTNLRPRVRTSWSSTPRC